MKNKKYFLIFTNIILLSLLFGAFQNCKEVEFEPIPSTVNILCTDPTSEACSELPKEPKCPNDALNCEIVIENPKQNSGTISYKQKLSSTKKLDLLIIIDTSSSLNTEKEAIKNGITGFIDGKFDDMQVAVMPAKVESKYAGRIYKDGSSSVPHVLKSEDYNLDSSSGVSELQNDLEQRLQETMDLDYGESALYSLYKALDDKNNLEFNKSVGFFRDNAALAILMVTDENDWCSRAYYPSHIEVLNKQTENEVSIFNEYCKTNSGEMLFDYHDIINLVAIQQDSNPFIMTGIFYQNPDTVYRKDSDSVDEVAYGVLETVAIANGINEDDFYDANILDGFAIDLADDEGNKKTDLEITEELDFLSDFISQKVELKNNFNLTIQNGYKLVLDSVKVYVDDVEVDFQLNTDSNGNNPLVIIQQGQQGDEGSVVMITYKEQKSN